MKSADELKVEILRLTREDAQRVHPPLRPGGDSARPDFLAGQMIPSAGRVFTVGVYPGLTTAMLEFGIETIHRFGRQPAPAT